MMRSGLAALRWFALTIEKEGIELYATNSATFPEIEKILRKALGEIDELRDKFAAQEGDCPEGYILCDDATAAGRHATKSAPSPTGRVVSVLDKQGAGVFHQLP